MPRYDYECNECGELQEVTQMMSDPVHQKLECQKCGRETAVTRCIGRGAGVIFRGPGFYCNDYPKAPNPSSKGD